MPKNSLQKLPDSAARLRNHGIHYAPGSDRGEALMALIATPGGRREFEFFADGRAEVGGFGSTAARGPHRELEGEGALERSFR